MSPSFSSVFATQLPGKALAYGQPLIAESGMGSLTIREGSMYGGLIQLSIAINLRYFFSAVTLVAASLLTATAEETCSEVPTSAIAS